jgi:hypothetical protein
VGILGVRGERLGSGVIVESSSVDERLPSYLIRYQEHD